MTIKIAYFISPHGFGHAARSAAIMESLNRINENIEFEIFTKVPEWFFTNSHINNFNYHEILTDIGLVQKSALKEDLNETVERLDNFFPFQEELLIKFSKELIDLECKLIVCDISPLGLEIAQKDTIPSVLIENFTWDWIYNQYNLNDSRLNKHIDYLVKIYNNATHRIKTRPYCYESKSDLITNPVSRKPKTDKTIIRNQLKIPNNNKVIMITMGGIRTHYNFYNELKNLKDICFIIPGASENNKIDDNLVLFPHNSKFFHPDLINSSDTVIGKVGYSTLAEIYDSGVPYGYILRSKFPESYAFSKFIEQNMNGIEISEQDFNNGKWIDNIERLLSLNTINRSETNGSDQAAEYIHSLL